MRQRSRVIDVAAPAVASVVGSTSTYGVFFLLDAVLFGGESEGWVIVLLGWVALAALLLALPWAFWFARSEIRSRLPPLPSAILTGAGFGALLCLLLDLPSVDLTRWKPYASAALAGGVAGKCFHSAVAWRRRLELAS